MRQGIITLERTEVVDEMKVQISIFDRDASDNEAEQLKAGTAREAAAKWMGDVLRETNKSELISTYS